MDFKIKGVLYRLTEHARKRMEKRGVTTDELEEALSNIKTRRLQDREGNTGRFLVTGRNKISAVVTHDNVIITVYPYCKEYKQSKGKSKFNKKRRQLKQMYGNRFIN